MEQYSLSEHEPPRTQAPETSQTDQPQAGEVSGDSHWKVPGVQPARARGRAAARAKSFIFADVVVACFGLLLVWVLLEVSW